MYVKIMKRSNNKMTEVATEEKIERLPQEKKKNGYNYHLVKRSEHAAIYNQVHPDYPDVSAYEVFKIVITKPTVLIDRRTNKEYPQPAKEKFPGNEDGGKTLWTYITLESAEKKFEEINTSATRE
jgi:hypothetical protein